GGGVAYAFILSVKPEKRRPVVAALIEVLTFALGAAASEIAFGLYPDLKQGWKELATRIVLIWVIFLAGLLHLGSDSAQEGPCGLTRRLQATARERLRFTSRVSGAPCLSRGVSPMLHDMLKFVLIASAFALTACSPSGPDRVTGKLS